MGMAEDDKFGNGYEAIFGKKGEAKKPVTTAKASTTTAKKLDKKKPTKKK